MGLFNDVWEGIKDIGQEIIDLHKDALNFLYNPFDVTSEVWRWTKHQLIPDMRRDREAMVTNATTPRRLIYGRTRVGGNLVYAVTSGDKLEFLITVVVFSGCQVDGFEEVWYNDRRVATYTGGAWVRDEPWSPEVTSFVLYDGTQTVAHSLVDHAMPGWTADHKLLGCAYGIFAFRYDESLYAGGIPQVKVVLRGKPIYDPRTTLTAWSDNPALCIRDYMLMSIDNGGMGCDSTEIDVAAVIAAANICDQTITEAAGEKRYTLNGMIGLDGTPASIVKSMLGAMAGQALYSGGVWKMYAGASSASVATLDESWLNGGIKFTTGTNKNDRINTAKGQFTNPADHWADTEFPAVSVAAYVTADGEELTADMSLPFTISQTAAQRLARIEIMKSRYGMSLTYPCKMMAAKLNAMDVVAINNTQLGWSGKLFRIMSWDFSAMGGVNLSLVEEDPSIWGDPATYGSLTPSSLTALPSPWTVAAPTGFTATESIYTTVAVAISKSKLALAWTSAQASGTMYDISFDGKIVATIPDTSYTLYDLDPGTYDVSVRARNGVGAVSTWVTIAKTINGKNTAPANVAGFTATFAGDVVKLAWTANADTDLAAYEIRTGASWAAGTKIQTIVGNAYTYRPTASGATTYWIAAIDTAGNYSATPASASATVPAADTPTAITTISKFLGVDLAVTYDTTRLDTAWVEVWAGTTNNRSAGTTVQIGITKNGKWSHEGLGNGDVRYYWVRTVTVFGETGAWYPSGATSGVTGTALNDPTNALKLLNSEVTGAKITDYLDGKTSVIDVLDTRSMVFELGVVGAGITTTYTDALKQASSEMNKNKTLLEYLNSQVAGLLVTDYSGTTSYTVGQIVKYSGQTYQCILASTGNLPTNATYWSPISGLYDLINTIQTNLDTATGTWTSTATTLTADLRALDNATTGRVTLAESTITQHGTSITLQGTAITGPLAFVVGSVTETGVVVETPEDISGLDLALSRTKIDLDTANNTILLQAGEVSSLTGRVSSAEVTIDGHTAAIALRATSADLSAEVVVLSDMIGLKLDATGTSSPGMAIGWTDGTHTKSLIEFRTDTLTIAKPDGTGSRPVFTVGSIGGASTVGINGNVLIDGTVSAQQMSTTLAFVSNTLMFGDATHNGTIESYGYASGTGIQIVGGATPSVNVKGGTITGSTLQTKVDPGSGDRSRFEVSSADNLAYFYNASNVKSIILGTGTDSDGYNYKLSVSGDTGDSAAIFAGYGASGIGIRGRCYNDGYGGSFSSVGTKGGSPIHWSTGKGAIRLEPTYENTAPTITADIGALHCTSSGVLYIYTSTGWQKVGAQ